MSSTTDLLPPPWSFPGSSRLWSSGGTLWPTEEEKALFGSWICQPCMCKLKRVGRYTPTHSRLAGNSPSGKHYGGAPGHPLCVEGGLRLEDALTCTQQQIAEVAGQDPRRKIGLSRQNDSTNWYQPVSVIIWCWHNECMNRTVMEAKNGKEELASNNKALRREGWRRNCSPAKKADLDRCQNWNVCWTELNWNLWSVLLWTWGRVRDSYIISPTSGPCCQMSKLSVTETNSESWL